MPSPPLREALSVRFRALRHRNFRLFWTGQLVSLTGTWMQSVAQGWLLHRLTDSPLMLGLLGFAQFMPVTALSLWAGVIADRVDPRRLLLTTQALALLQAATLATVTTLGVVEPWMVLALAFAFGALNAFDLPARQSAVVELVGRDKEDLSNAIALNSAAFNVARIVGPAIAGVLVALLGEQGCFWANAATYVAVLAGLWRVRIAPREHVAGGSTLAALREGWRYAFGTVPIRNLLVLVAIAAGLGFQYMTLLPEYARTILRVDAGRYGLMVSAFGLGALTAALLMTRRLDRWDLRRNLLVGLVAAGVGQAVFAWSRSLPLTLAMGFVSGFGLILYVASTNTMLQLTTEDRFRGRIMSLYTFMFVGTAPFGAILAGAVAQRFGAPLATSLCALILLGSALWVARRLRFLREQEAARALATPGPAATEKLG
uniref:MFS transporter n=1 Tax=Eiseniibacteriota bacterium TaxID=2212470 RepID=A0A832MKC7_UNCEI